MRICTGAPGYPGAPVTLAYSSAEYAGTDMWVGD